MNEQMSHDDPFDYLPNESTVNIDTSKSKFDQDEIKAMIEEEDRTVANDIYLNRPNAVHTLLLEAEDQSDTMTETLERIQRVAFPLSKVVSLLGVVAPETDEEVNAWSKVHKDHTAVALDNKEGNIAARLREGGVIVVASPKPEIIDRFDHGQKLKARFESWERLESEVTPEQKARNNNKTSGFSSAYGRVIASKDWQGSLEGGPLRVGGITNSSPK